MEEIILKNKQYIKVNEDESTEEEKQAFEKLLESLSYEKNVFSCGYINIEKYVDKEKKQKYYYVSVLDEDHRYAETDILLRDDSGTLEAVIDEVLSEIESGIKEVVGEYKKTDDCSEFQLLSKTNKKRLTIEIQLDYCTTSSFRGECYYKVHAVIRGDKLLINANDIKEIILDYIERENEEVELSS